MREVETTSFWRQLDFVSPGDLASVRVTLIGCGGIGSFAAYALAKLGVTQFELWDDDKVEAHNIPNQLFPRDALGKNKAEALRDLLVFFEGDIAIDVHASRWTGEPLEGVVISAVDDMDVRKQVWDRCKWNPSVSLVIDGRIGGEQVRVLSVSPTNPEDIKAYEKTLHTNGEAAELPCTARAIIDVAFLVTALITRVFRGWVKTKERKSYVATMHEPMMVEVTGG